MSTWFSGDPGGFLGDLMVLQSVCPLSVSFCWSKCYILTSSKFMGSIWESVMSSKHAAPPFPMGTPPVCAFISRPSHTHCSKRSLAAGGVILDTTPFTYSWLMNLSTKRGWISHDAMFYRKCSGRIPAWTRGSMHGVQLSIAHWNIVKLFSSSSYRGGGGSRFKSTENLLVHQKTLRITMKHIFPIKYV